MSYYTHTTIYTCILSIYITSILADTLRNETGISADCTPSAMRIDCHPDPDATRQRCESRGCTWCVAESGAPEGTPWCFTPPDYGYRMIGRDYEIGVGRYAYLRKNSQSSSYYGNDFESLMIWFEYWDEYHLRIRIVPERSARYEVPLNVRHPGTPFPFEREYRLDFTRNPFSFRVIRNSTGVVLLDTSMGGLVYSSQFLQFSTKLPSTNVYGIGENEQHTFKHDFTKFQTFALWARDQHPDEFYALKGNTNSYGVHPYYTVIEPDGNAHSIMIVNSNAMEFVTMPAPGITYRTIGGILDIHMFLGPTPDKTVQQFTKAVGRAPIPPYWALGFQLSRWGYNNLANMRAAVERTRRYNIPHDVQYGDIDIMERALDFTISEANFGGLVEYVRALRRDEGIKFIPILDPGISPNERRGTYRPFDLANEMERSSTEKLWIRRPDGTPTVGRVWPGDTYFPDFSANITRTWWITLIKEFNQKLEFDGLWIDMNEPANWAAGDAKQRCVVRNNQNPNYNKPPYVPRIKDRQLHSQTICPDAQQKFGVHYDTHSLYGWSQSEPTLAGVREATGKRSMVLSRSTYLGAGKWAAHWLGDNFSKWSNLHYSIIGMLQFNTFGIPLVGADICGFVGDATEELCLRWQQLGAFYPFSRNHNAIGTRDQDPGAFGPAVAKAAREALETRYTLLPYLYTLFYRHAIEGSTVVRSLGFEFPTDSEALRIDKQFLWGGAIMISPVLEQGKDTVSAYFPDALWYNYYTGARLNVRKSYATLRAPLETIPLHLRGGYVLPTQRPGINTREARKNDFGLIIALDQAGTAAGELYIDDGDSIEPVASGKHFQMRFWTAFNICRADVVRNGYDVSRMLISTVRLLGARRTVRLVTVNDKEHSAFSNLPSGEVLITDLKIPLNRNFHIRWG